MSACQPHVQLLQSVSKGSVMAVTSDQKLQAPQECKLQIWKARFCLAHTILPSPMPFLGAAAGDLEEQRPRSWSAQGFVRTKGRAIVLYCTAMQGDVLHEQV